jgi:hypothetical protein
MKTTSKPGGRAAPAGLLAVAIALALSACGGSVRGGSGPSTVSSPAAQASSQATIVDFCALLTGDDVASVLGAPVTGALTSTAAKETCTYTSATHRLVISKRKISTAADFSAAKNAFSGEAVSGVGDEAFYGDSVRLVGFSKGGVYFDVQAAFLPSGADTKATLVAVAKKLAQKV